MNQWYSALAPQTKTSIIMVIVISLVLFLISFKIKKIDPLKKPKGVQVIGEMAVDGINNFSKEFFGRYYKIYAPYFLTLVFFIGGGILFGLLGFMTPLAKTEITVTLGLVTFAIIQITGLITQGVKGYFGGFLAVFKDKNPFKILLRLIIWVIMLPLNLIGEVAIPISLGLRLFGNILSGLIMLTIIYGIMGYWAVFLTPGFHAVFDVFFGLIQVFVFTLLSAVFISSAIPEEKIALDK